MEWKIALINIITGHADFFLSKHVLINPGRRCGVKAYQQRQNERRQKCFYIKLSPA
jgi:hypothetical protein